MKYNDSIFKIRPAAALLLIASMAGSIFSCGIGPADLAPGMEPSDVDLPSAYEGAGGAGQQVLDDSLRAAAGGQWWKIFSDPMLDRLVSEAIENNYDIRKATAAVREIGSRLTQARAGRLPSVSASGSYQKQYSPEASAMPGTSGERERDSYTVSLAASFEIDLWGKLANAHEAAGADLLASIENRRTVVHSIISETVSLYLQIEALERRIEIARANIESAGKSVEIAESRYRRGLVSILDLKQSKRSYAQVQSSLPQLEQELGKAQQALSVLTGKYPETFPARSHGEDYFTRLSPVPAGLPSSLLETRPDIAAAEARLAAAAARVGVARSNLFPRITLTGNHGYTSDELESLFTPASLLWNLAAGITQPIFNSGSLIAEKNAAWARYEQAAADYSKTLLNAFAEVEGALLTRQRQLERREKILEYLDEARQAQRIAESRYNRGLTGYLAVLESMQARFSAEESLVLVDLAILGNRVTLHRALGGRWIDTAVKKDE